MIALNNIYSFFKTRNLVKKIEQTKQNIKKRNEIISFEVLGRSLALNPYLPRDFWILKESSQRVVLVKEISSQRKISLIKNENIISINTELSDEIALVGIVRRYSPCLIIHNDIFISRYQILESLVYGADVVVLDESILGQQELLDLYNFALHLGLGVALKPQGGALNAPFEIAFTNNINIQAKCVIRIK